MKALVPIMVFMSGATLLVMGKFAIAAHASVERSRQKLERVSLQAQELVERRRQAREDRVPLKPQVGLAAAVSAALARAGLPPATLQSLSPESAVTGGRYVRQRATLALTGLNLPQFGTFLQSWRAGEPGWIISRIDLSPVDGASTDRVTGGADLPLRAVLSLEGVFREDRLPVRAPGAPP